MNTKSPLVFVSDTITTMIIRGHLRTSRRSPTKACHPSTFHEKILFQPQNDNPDLQAASSVTAITSNGNARPDDVYDASMVAAQTIAKSCRRMWSIRASTRAHTSVSNWRAPLRNESASHAAASNSTHMNN